MYVSSIFLDRFGRRSALRLQDLSEGLQVIYGAPGTGKSTLVDFLSAMWTGFDGQLRDRYLPPDSRGFGGVVTLETPRGRQTVSRYDDGGVEGRLTIEHADGAVIGRRDLRDLFGDLPATLLRRAFLVDFQRSPRLEDLLEATAGMLEFEDRSVGVERQLRDLEATCQRIRTALEQTAQPSQSEEALQARRSELLSRVNQPPQEPIATESLPQEITALDRQLRRWKRTARELARRKQDTWETLEAHDGTQTGDTSPTAATRERLGEMEWQILDLGHALDRVASRPATVSGDELRAVFSGPLGEIRDELYRLCNDISRCQDQDRRRELHREWDHWGRAERELRRAIRQLRFRRQALVRQWQEQQPRSTQTVDHAGYCQCSQHPTTACVPAAVKTLDLRTGGEYRAELARIERELEVWQTRLRLQTDLATREEERRKLLQLPAESGLPRRAAEYLRRLSGGEFTGLQVHSPREVVVETASGQRLSTAELFPGGRTQVYLAFCLAIAAACDRRGLFVPLVFNGVFDEYPAVHVRGAMELLCELSRGRQVLCLTRHEHVLDVSRTINVPVRLLSPRPEPTAVPPPAVLTVEPRREVSSRPATLALPTAIPEPRADLWEPEPLPGDFSERTLGGTRPLPVPPPDSDYFLEEQDLLERFPALDETNLGRLKSLHLRRVGDLLRVPAAEIANDLRPTGVTLELVLSWQAQARLMCHVRRLRAYDARVLVACGITSPEQLTRLTVADLRERVQRFAASAEGQAALLSGTESELSRITDWIRSAADRHGDRPRKAEAAPERAPASTPKASHDQRRTNKRRGPRADRPTTDDSHSATVPLPSDGLRSRFHLRRSDPVVDAPSIGSHMARRLERVGVATVAALLDMPAAEISGRLQIARVTPEVIQRWQQQAALVCRVPSLRGHDAQILVAVGVADAEQLAAAATASLWPRVQAYAESLEGKRSIRPGSEPTLEETSKWIESAREARSLSAA